MAGNLAGLDSSEVGLSRQGTPTLDVPAHPQAFGIGVGQAVEGIGQEAGHIAIQQRRLNAIFDATDRELSGGAQLDASLRTFKDQLKNGKPDDGETYPNYVARLTREFQQRADQIHSEGMSALKDPLAQKNFTVRMRLQTQAYLRHVGIVADQQVSNWRTMLGNANADQVLQESGDVVSSNVRENLDHLGNLFNRTGAFEAALKDQMLPDDEQHAKISQLQRGMVEKKLAAYLAAGNWKGGLGLLNGKIFDGLRVAFDAKDQKTESVLNGATADAWRAKFENQKDQETAVGKERRAIGLGWQMASEGVRDPMAYLKDFVAQAQTPEEKVERQAQAEHALAAYDGIMSRREAAQLRGERRQYKNAYDVVVDKYDRDVDAALTDGALRGMPKMQIDQLRMDMERKDNDPRYDEGMATAATIMSQPGFSEKWKGNAEDFEADMVGLVGRRNARRLLPKFTQDVKRKPEHDTVRGFEHRQLEDDLRAYLDFPLTDDPESRNWGNAAEWQRSLRAWAIEQYGIAEAQVDQDMRKGVAPAPDWSRQTRQKIFQTILQGKKRAGKSTPIPTEPIFERSQARQSFTTSEMEALGYKRYKVGSDFVWFSPRETVPPEAIDPDALPPGQR